MTTKTILIAVTGAALALAGCGAAPSAKSPVSHRAVEEEPPLLDLFADAAEVDRRVSVSVTGGDAAHVVVRLDRVGEDGDEVVRIEVPRGTTFVSESEDVSDVVVCEPRTFELGVGRGDWGRMDVVSVDLYRTRGTLAGKSFEPAPPHERLLRYLEACTKANAAWSVTQIGVWALLQDVPGVQVDRLQVEAQSAFGGFPQGMRMGGYKTYREVERLLVEAGEDAADFDVCQHGHELLRRCLAPLRRENWQAEKTLHLGRNVLVEYGERELERAYLEIAEHHPHARCREDAVRALLGYRFAGTPARLLERALASESLIESFAVAETLRWEDARGFALLLPGEDHPLLAKHLEKRVARDLARKTKSSREPGESFSSYWGRVVGWDRLAADCGDVTRLRDWVERRQGK